LERKESDLSSKGIIF